MLERISRCWNGYLGVGTDICVGTNISVLEQIIVVGTDI